MKPRTRKSQLRTQSRYLQYQNQDTSSISEASFQYDVVRAASMNGWRIDLSHATPPTSHTDPKDLPNILRIRDYLLKCFPRHGLPKVRDFLLSKRNNIFTLCYHTHNSQNSQKGFPDLTIVHPERSRIMFLELKDDHKYPSTEQRLWAAALMSCHHQHPEAITYRLVRPKHYHSLIEDLGGIDPLACL